LKESNPVITVKISKPVFEIFSKAPKKNNMPELTNFREFDKIFLYF